MRLDGPFKDWRTDGAAMMFESLVSIQRSYLTPMIFLLKSEWNLLGKCPAYDFKDSRAGVMGVEDKDDIP